mgnify:CR=1 FL=1
MSLYNECSLHTYNNLFEIELIRDKLSLYGPSMDANRTRSLTCSLDEVNEKNQILNAR